jgi:hypothetical protein
MTFATMIKGLAMRPDDFRDLLKRQPFQPFRPYLSNGMSYDVRHPEMAWLGKNVVLIGRPAPEFPHFVFENDDVITLMHINNVERLPVAAPPGTNGPGQAP